MKRIFFLIPILLLFSCKEEKKVEAPDYPISFVDIRNVKLEDQFWLKKIQTIQETTIQYSFDKCDREGRMENFLIAGGQKPGPCKGVMPFDDTDLYKIIEGASLSLATNPNPSLDSYIDSIVSIIAIGQEPDGYITTWFTYDREHPTASWVNPSKNRWENEIASHELYNSGHMFEAAAAHYWATGKNNFLDIALKNADLLVDNFGPGKLGIPPGHQIVETGLIKLYRITHKDEYLKLAKEFLDFRGDTTTHKLYGAYNQDHMPVIDQKEAVGHAVRALYMYAGMTDVAVLYNDSNYQKAISAIWDNVVGKKTYLTGGLGARHEGESFGDDYELPNLTSYSETCAAIASVYWNQRLFQQTGNSKYYDVIERTLYNGLIVGISIDGKNFFYPNPLEADGKFPFNRGNLTRAPWFDCSCCPTNMIRFLPSVPSLAYATDDKQNVYVNLFMSSKANVEVANQTVQIEQKTDYPWNGDVLLQVNPEKAGTFTVKIRIPGWVQNQVLPSDLYAYEGESELKPTIKINGEPLEFVLNEGYAEINRTWNANDQIELSLPMAVREVVANANVKDLENQVAFEYGPIVYCAEEIDNPEISEIQIPENVSLNVASRAISAEQVNVLQGTANGKDISLIPYYLWSNRGVGKMKVWFPTGN